MTSRTSPICQDWTSRGGTLLVANKVSKAVQYLLRIKAAAGSRCQPCAPTAMPKTTPGK